MKEWSVVAGPASLEVGATLASKLGTKLARVDTNDFPDGESKVRVHDELRNKNVIIVQSLYPPTDKHLYLLLLMAHKLSEDGADVSAAIPYLAYARQDREFLKGEVISLGVVAHLFRSVGIRRMVTIDIHSAQGLGLFSIPAYSCSAIPLLAEHVAKNCNLNNPIAVSPDFGSSTRVEAFAAVLKSEYVSFKKTRNRETGEIVTEGKEDLNLAGHDAVIIDDMISTGTSVVKCAHLLRKLGVNRIITACTHPLMVGGAAEKMKAAGIEEIISSNTIPSKYSRVDVAPLFASYFQRL